MNGGRLRRRYGLLLIILLTSYLLSAFLRTRWITGIEVALFLVAGLLALRDSPIRRPIARMVATIGVVVSAVLIIVSASIATDEGRAAAAIWTALLLLLTVALLIRQILLMPTVTIQSIYGAISAYLIIGLLFAAVYSASYYLNGGKFFADGQPGNSSTFQYFSFSTLTTLGYGDFTALKPGGRAIAMIEAMTGQIFLATLVARLVAAFRPTSPSADQDGPSRDSTAQN
jgi:hypothetical protein